MRTSFTDQTLMVKSCLLLSLLSVGNALPQPLSPDSSVLARSTTDELPDKTLIKRQGGIIPAGASTSGICRAKVGSVPYGRVITSCTTPGVVALTFDDGPNVYTNELLDLLDRYNVKATFFLAGNNGQAGGMDVSFPDVVRRQYNSGHQIASHTWTHPSLNGLTESQVRNEIYWNEMSIRNMIGVVPTYLRPPYLECDSTCESRLNTLGYHTISVDLDTQDWQYTDPSTNINAQNIFKNAIAARPASALVLSHDIHATTVRQLAEVEITTALNAGYRLVTVGECLGDPKENWYRSPTAQCGTTPVPPPTNPSPTSPAPSPTSPAPSPTAGPSKAKTTDGQCGANGRTCADSGFGRCCSQYGWCGVTTDHCGGGCQSAFGSCN